VTFGLVLPGESIVSSSHFLRTRAIAITSGFEAISPRIGADWSLLMSLLAAVLLRQRGSDVFGEHLHGLAPRTPPAVDFVQGQTNSLITLSALPPTCRSRSVGNMTDQNLIGIGAAGIFTCCAGKETRSRPPTARCNPTHIGFPNWRRALRRGTVAAKCTRGGLMLPLHYIPAPQESA